MVSLDEVRKTTQALKRKASSHKDKSILSVVEQLSYNLTLLELSSPSSKLLENLSLQFRKPLVPLYSIFTAHACRFAATLFAFIYENKVEKNEDDEVVLSWEKVLNAILAGLVDYLEDSAVCVSNKSIVANSFYVPLCRIYFPWTTTQKEPDIVLRCTIYILLCESITGHPENQRKLRNDHLSGGKLLGLALSRSRAYLAIEALLELFANLLPEKGYSEFLNNVFDAGLFPAHETLKSIVGTARKADWEKISRQICRVFADVNIAYPQPFRIIKSSITGKLPSPVGQLYVDEKGFISNIDEDDAYETFDVPYLIIDKIRYSSYKHSPTCTTFTFKLKSTPAVGWRGADDNGEITWTIDLERHRLPAFLKVLKARNLVQHIDQPDRKMSKIGDELSFELPPSSRTLSEKVQQFCDFPSESALPASPIVALEDSAQVLGSNTPKATLSTPSKLPQQHSEQADVRLDLGPYDQKSSKQMIKGVKRVAAQIPDSPPSKRKRLDVPEGPNQRPQRSRVKPANGNPNIIASQVFDKSPKTTKRYGKKLRTSSPKAPLDGESNYEEIPAPQVTFKTSRKTQAGERKSIKEIQEGPGEKRRNDARETTEAVDTHEQQPRRSARVKKQGELKPDYKDVSDGEDVQVVQAILAYNEKERTKEGPVDISKEGTSSGTNGSHDVEILYQDTVVPLKSASDENSDRVTRKEQKPTTIDLTLDNNDDDSLQFRSNNRKQSHRHSKDKSKQDGKARRKIEVIDIEEDATVVYEQNLPWSPKQLRQASKLHISDLPKANMSPFASSDNQTITDVKSIEVQQKKVLDPSGSLHKAQPILAKASSKSSYQAPSNPAVFIPNTVKGVSSKVVPLNNSVAPLYAPTFSPEPVNEEPIEDFPSLSLAKKGGSSLVVPPPNRNAIVPRPARIEIPERPSPSLRAQRTAGLVKDSPDLKPLRKASATARQKETSADFRLSVIRLASTDCDKLDLATRDKKPTTYHVPVLSTPLHAAKQLQRFEFTSMVEHGPLPIVSPVKKRPVQVDGLISTSVGFKSAFRRTDSGLRRTPERNGFDLDLEGSPYPSEKGKKTVDVVDILNDIQQVLINKFTKRILNVKTEVRVGRDSILRDAAADIEEMRIESASCFNALLDLDSEYSSYNRDVLERLEDVSGVIITIGRKLEEILEHHDRNTLSKRFPKTLFPLPNTLTNPQL